MARFFLAAFLLIFAAPALAEDYKPGSVGHLYADCRAALEKSTKYTELQETYCGAFSEGYFWGAAASHGAMLTPDPHDPCAGEKKKEYDRINNRFCGNFPSIGEKTTTGEALRSASSIVARWIEFEKGQGGKDPLKRGTLREVNSLVRPGPFCEALAQSYPVREAPFAINPALMKLNLMDFMKAKASMTLKAKYNRCKKDVAAAKGNPKTFLATKCGAEISGYISGVYSTQHLQKNRAEPAPQCKKEINRLYKNLDVGKTMCVGYDTNPLWVAEIFLEKYPQIKNTGNGWGGIGNLIIYRGFLCAEEEAERRKNPPPPSPGLLPAP